MVHRPRPADHHRRRLAGSQHELIVIPFEETQAVIAMWGCWYIERNQSCEEGLAALVTHTQFTCKLSLTLCNHFMLIHKTHTHKQNVLRQSAISHHHPPRVIASRNPALVSGRMHFHISLCVWIWAIRVRVCVCVSDLSGFALTGLVVRWC